METQTLTHFKSFEQVNTFNMIEEQKRIESYNNQQIINAKFIAKTQFHDKWSSSSNGINIIIASSLNEDRCECCDNTIINKVFKMLFTALDTDLIERERIKEREFIQLHDEFNSKYKFKYTYRNEMFEYFDKNNIEFKEEDMIEEEEREIIKIEEIHGLKKYFCMRDSRG